MNDEKKAVLYVGGWVGGWGTYQGGLSYRVFPIPQIINHFLRAQVTQGMGGGGGGGGWLVL